MNRRELFKYLAALFAGMFFSFKGRAFAKKPDIEHPLVNPPAYTDKKRCDNCGMDRNKFARTRHEFQNAKGKFHTCSIFCVAVLTMKTQAKPEQVRVAEYFHPEKMLDADKAVYLIGSTAPGTMTLESKIAFASREEAEKFAADYGGQLAGFQSALSESDKEIHQHQHSH